MHTQASQGVKPEMTHAGKGLQGVGRRAGGGPPGPLFACQRQWRLSIPEPFQVGGGSGCTTAGVGQRKEPGVWGGLAPAGLQRQLPLPHRPQAGQSP